MTVPEQVVTKPIAAKQVATKQTVTEQSAMKWGAALHIPDAVTIDGQEWSVRRAWPAGDSRIAWEASLPGQGIRVGYLDEHGVRVLDADRDPKLPGLARLLADGGRLVSHRPGKRAVVRLPDGSFAKCVRSGRAAAILAGQRRAQAFAVGFALPEVLAADDSTAVLSRLSGVELHDPARLGEDWKRAWSECLEAWARAGSSGRSGEAGHAGAATGGGSTGVEVPAHSAASEVQVLTEWQERAANLLGPSRHRVDVLVSDVSAELIDQAPETAEGSEPDWGPIHRDLHDKQLMWDPVLGPGLLDVDTACRGERELDLGNLAAHARWRCAQGLWTESEAEVVLDAICTAASASGSDTARIRTYERAALLRLACVYAFRPRWSDRTGILLDAVESNRSEAVRRRASTG
ncbi:phosphotransferase [Brevibacterium sp. VCM10]|uniref:phosphotransferase n=1 Tax=Brevibacterium sp. VCM10 TaxID=1381751 RepID=UPI000471981A|nr:phosphotransferase [Brevibacterium sp. VCM10]